MKLRDALRRREELLDMARNDGMRRSNHTYLPRSTPIGTMARSVSRSFRLAGALFAGLEPILFQR
jgi:hypothetical protein